MLTLQITANLSFYWGFMQQVKNSTKVLYQRFLRDVFSVSAYKQAYQSSFYIQDVKVLCYRIPFDDEPHHSDTGGNYVLWSPKERP
jgi:hypothetical protein